MKGTELKKEIVDVDEEEDGRKGRALGHTPSQVAGGLSRAYSDMGHTRRKVGGDPSDQVGRDSKGGELP